MFKDRDKSANPMAKSAKNRVSFGRFKRILEAYGADSARWPVDERASAHALAENDLRAKTLLAEARGLDRALSALPRPDAPDSAYVKRLAAIPYAEGRKTSAPARPRWMGTFAAALGIQSVIPQGIAIAAAGAVGIWLGLSLNVPNGAAVELTDTAYFAFNPDLDKDLEEAR